MNDLKYVDKIIDVIDAETPISVDKYNLLIYIVKSIVATARAEALRDAETLRNAIIDYRHNGSVVLANAVNNHKHATEATMEAALNAWRLADNKLMRILADTPSEPERGPEVGDVCGFWDSACEPEVGLFNAMAEDGWRYTDIYGTEWESCIVLMRAAEVQRRIEAAK